jgi:molybdopterin molybdotransferase
MLSYEEAVRVVLETVRPMPPEKVPLQEALGRVTAEPVLARWDLPPANNSAMDGFAFSFSGQRAGDRLAVAGFLPAGSRMKEKIPPGQAVKIMTGAPLPDGCDTVVPIEDVDESDDGVRLNTASRSGQHVRLRGEELRQGEEILPAGVPIHSGEMGLLAAGGIDRLRIVRPPRVALLSTGDELVELGETPGPGRIVNSNSHLLSSRLREEGLEVVSLGIARDEKDELAARVAAGLEADMLISTGGVSVGDRDHVQETLAHFGFQLGFWRVRIKPGKPVLFGTAQGRPVFALPGNPAASAATF